jgi:predicted dehydrogenase
MRPLRVAIVGCGEIAGEYQRWLHAHERVELVGAYDLRSERAEALATKFDGNAYASLEDLVADEHVDAVLNFTIERVHAQVTRPCLEGGKHVYSEKPLALSSSDARMLIELAEARGLVLGCAPSLYLAPPEQTAWKLIREGHLGAVRVIYVDLNWGRVESGHPEPAPYYQVGPLWGVAPYAMTALTTMFGPARRVLGEGRILLPQRSLENGERFDVTAPDCFFALVDLEAGPVVRLTTNYYVEYEASRSRQVEMHGDLGSLYYADSHDDDPRVEFAPHGASYERVPLLTQPYERDPWAAGVIDFVEAIAGEHPLRVSAQHAAHLVDIFEGLTTSALEGGPVTVTSDFPPPAWMDWACEPGNGRHIDEPEVPLYGTD